MDPLQAETDASFHCIWIVWRNYAAQDHLPYFRERDELELPDLVRHDHCIPAPRQG